MESELFDWVPVFFGIVAALLFLAKFRVFSKSIVDMMENIGLLFVGKIMYMLGVAK